MGAKIAALAVTASFSQMAFAKHLGVPFPLLSDWGREACTAYGVRYGVWKEKEMYGKPHMGIERTTFVIGPDGRIARVFPKVKVEGHADEVLEAVREL